MEYRPLGSTKLKVSVLGFGCAPIGSRAGVRESQRALTLAYDQGINYFDTADMYGVGASEEILGRVFKGKRDKIILASKCGYAFSGRLKALRWVKPLLRPLVMRLKRVKSSAAAIMTSQRTQCFDPQYVEKCVHDSLGRLGTDHIDLFFLHDPPMSIAERGETFQMLGSLKRAGKIRHYGVSCDVDVARRVLESADSGVSVVQVNVNLLQPEALVRVLPLAKQKGIGFIARQPFENGRLFESEQVMSELRARTLSSDPQSVAGLALRFLHQTEGVATILPSMMRPAHLHANIAAIAAGPLTPQERAFADAMTAGRKSGLDVDTGSRAC